MIEEMEVKVEPRDHEVPKSSRKSAEMPSNDSEDEPQLDPTEKHQDKPETEPVVSPEVVEQGSGTLDTSQKPGFSLKIDKNSATAQNQVSLGT